ncbi:MAG TPA: SDR family oxidoreductase [Nitrospinota bacterium]|nr:SDR family oxidoreductase [Nitrospinota bacterium]
MNICITGALGHIGSKLIRNLSISSVDKVYLIDNFFTQRYSSLFNLPSGINYCFYEMDILSDEIEPIIKDSSFVIHLAAITGAESSFQYADLIDKVNKKGVDHIAQLCAKYKRSLMFFSTTSVYGSQDDRIDENCKESDLNPQSPYAESKLYGEKFLQSLVKEKGFPFIILRLGTIFGYSIGMRFHTAVNKFIWQASSGKDITVWKTALNQMRPYCGLNDCIKAINYIINNKIFDCQIYNIVTTNLTVKDILDAIKLYIPDIKIKFVDSPIMNQLSYHVSNKKSLERGFTYCNSFNEGIKETIEKLQNINFSIIKNNM